MVSIDGTWVIVWFGIGLLSFFIPKTIPNVKATLAVFSITLLVILALRTNLFEISKIIVDDVVTSTASSLAYLFGANISRSFVMKINLSYRIVIYAVVLGWLLFTFG